MNLTITDTPPEPVTKLYVAATPLPFASLKGPDGEPLRVENGPVAFLPVFENREKLIEFNPTCDFFTLETK